MENIYVIAKKPVFHRLITENNMEEIVDDEN